MESQKFKVLLVHKDINLLKDLKNFLKKYNYQVFACKTSEFTIFLQKKVKPEIIITTLEPEGILKNIRYLKTITEVPDPPVVLLFLENKEEVSLTIKDSINIFEYIYIDNNLKPFLISVLESAKKYYIEKHNLFKYLQEYQQNWKKQIEWYLWKEQHKTLFKTNFSKKLIENIRNSLLQGLGISSIISYVDLMEIKKQDFQDHYLIPKEYFSKLKNNIDTLNLWLNHLERLLYYMNLSFELEEIDYNIMQKILYNVIKDIEEFRVIKNHELIIGNIYFKGTIQANQNALYLIFKELLINAMKYSPDNSIIDIIIFDNKENILIGIINDILEFQGGITGIPEEYENQIFEPFVRLNHHFDERFINEDFILGTGLSMIKLYLQYFNGQIYLKEIMDYTRESKKRILCGVTLPK